MLIGYKMGQREKGNFMPRSFVSQGQDWGEIRPLSLVAFRAVVAPLL